ncbi:hypothetical protein Prudu_020371 [Prunus dulcis]|uniref:Glycerophosphocholine acyltransferase 1 n=1 Tax=Prunus dulcis TaxID=3755 RepID=A0A4Y1RV43_PRUDU|nr:hypothetical protein Prudu_020371 [Prunus dulcis]
MTMSNNEEPVEETNGDSFHIVKQGLKDRSKKVAQTKEILSKQAIQTREILSKQAVKIAKQAEEHEKFINKVTHLVGVLGFGGFCFLLGASKDPKIFDIKYNGFKLDIRELSKKAQKANNVWWRLSGLLGDQNRLLMFILLQAVFTVATMALTVPIFLSYELHVVFQILKVSASVWNGGSFLLEVMPRQVILKEKKKLEVQPVQTERDQSTDDDGGTNNSAEASSPN